MTVGHRHAVRRPAQHLHVVGHVAEGDDRVGGQPSQFRQADQARGLVRVRDGELDQTVAREKVTSAKSPTTGISSCAMSSLRICGAREQLHRRRISQVDVVDDFVVGVEPRVLIPGGRDERSRRRVVRGRPGTFGGQAGLRQGRLDDLDQLAQPWHVQLRC